MRFLKGMMKTPDEGDENQDEFNAEDNGLLMAQPLPAEDDKVANPPAPAADAPIEEPPGEQPESPVLSEDATTAIDTPEALESEEDATAVAEQTPDSEAEAEGEPAEATEAEGETAESTEAASPEEGSSGDPLDLFRVAAKRGSLVPSLKDDLEDVSAATLLAEARALRDYLVGGQSSDKARPSKEQAA